MGDPKKLKKKYATPAHPWVKANIEEERKLTQEYGLKNKREILIANSFLKKYKDIAKKLIAVKTVQGEKEKDQVLNKLKNLGLLTTESSLDSILGLELRDVLNRRIQSVVLRSGLARSMKQSRQFITHRHITLGDKEITSPAYLLTLKEESELRFKEKSTLSSEDHPERGIMEKIAEIKEEKKAIEEGKSVEKLKTPEVQSNQEEIQEDIQEDIQEEDKGIDEKSTDLPKVSVDEESKEENEESKEEKKEVPAENKDEEVNEQ